MKKYLPSYGVYYYGKLYEKHKSPSSATTSILSTIVPANYEGRCGIIELWTANNAVGKR